MSKSFRQPQEVILRTVKNSEHVQGLCVALIHLARHRSCNLSNLNMMYSIELGVQFLWEHLSFVGMIRR